MLILKKLVAPVILPLPLSVELLFVALALFLFTGRHRLAIVLVSISTMLLTVCSVPVVATRLVDQWQTTYAPLNPTQGLDGCFSNGTERIGWIVILGGGNTVSQARPMTGQLTYAAVSRLAEGIRLSRVCPDARIVVSGGGDRGSPADARIMADALKELGVEERKVLTEPSSRDTSEQARNVRRIVGTDPIALVTSPSHMQRAALLFQSEGMHLIPAPATYQLSRQLELGPNTVHPVPWALGLVQDMVKEQCGAVWARIISKLPRSVRRQSRFVGAGRPFGT